MRTFLIAIVALLAFAIPASAATKAPAAAPAAIPSLSDAIDDFVSKIENVEADTIAKAVAAIEEADADAGTIVTPAIPAIAAVPATATSPAVAAFPGAPAVVKDPISHACYPAQITYLQALPTAKPIKSPAPFNLIPLFQYKRDFVNLLLSGQLLPTYLKLGCAPMLGQEVAIFAATLGVVGIGATALAPITAFAGTLGAAAVAFPTIGALVALPK